MLHACGSALALYNPCIPPCISCLEGEHVLAYEMKWLDEANRVLTVNVSDPVSVEEFKQMLARMREIAAIPRPFFLLADLSRFDLMSAVSAVREAIEGE